MKLIKLVNFVLIFVLSNCKLSLLPIEDFESSTISAALSDFIEVFYIENDVKFDFFLPYENFEMSLSNILARKSINFLSEVKLFWISERLKITQSAVFFLFSCEDLMIVHQKVEIFNGSPQKLIFLMVLKGCDFKTMQLNIEHLVTIQSHEKNLIDTFEFLLFDDENYLLLATIEWFTETACNHPQLTLLNSFNKVTQKWNKELKFYEKFNNFHSCKLILAIDPSNRGKCLSTQLIPRVFKIMSKKYNYKPSFVDDPEFSKKIFKHVYVDVIKPNEVGGYGYSLVHMTTTFLEVREIVVTTPGEFYSSFEKLSLPFDDATWIFLNLIFFVAFLSILIINRLPKYLQTRIYGKNIKTPALNVISTFFGIPQNKIPVSHVARFLLILFVFFCLIFRTCYQSKMFEFLTSSPRKSPPKTIDDLKDRNYTLYVFYASEEWNKYVAEDSQKWPRTVFLQDYNAVHVNMYYDLLETQSENASAKIAFIIQALDMEDFEQHNKKSLKLNKIPSFSFFVSQVGFSLYSNNFFFENINEVVQHLVSAGIMDMLVKRCVTKIFKIINMKEPFVLTLENLQFGFIIWIGCCAACVSSFIAEFLFWILKSAIDKLMKKNTPRKMIFAKVHPMNVDEDVESQNSCKQEETNPVNSQLNQQEVMVEDFENETIEIIGSIEA